MQLRVQFQGQLRTAIGRSEQLVELPEGSSLGSLLTALGSLGGTEVARQLLTANGDVQPCLLIARNGAAVSRSCVSTTTLAEGDVIVLLPPIAGG